MKPKLFPSISLVVLNWNGRDDTLACLRSVEQIDYPNFSTLVVDNGSSDDSVSAIRTAYPQVEVIQTGANLGFSGGNNAGIKRALELGANYVLLLNNDTIVDRGLLRAFIAAADRFPNAGAFSAKIYFHDDPQRIWYAGVTWDVASCRFAQVGEGLQEDNHSHVVARETDYACGCAFFVSTAKLREIGLLDDKFFLFFEETDWCYRARRAGYPSIFVPEAKLWHKVSASFGGESSPLALYFITRNRLLWAERHAELSRRLGVHAKSVRSLVRRFVLPLTGARLQAPFTLRGWWWSVREAFRDQSNLAYFLGVRDFWLRRFGDCPPVVRGFAKRAQVSIGEAASPVSQPE